MTKLFALLKWVSGEDKGKYTAGIPIEWIQDFNYETYQDETPDPDYSYVIEWRDTRKKPKGGWKCYDAVVVTVNGMIYKNSIFVKKLSWLRNLTRFFIINAFTA